MNDSIARAKFIDKLMTAVFYCVAGFFILLLVAFALYVIINGFKDFSWSLISFEGSGIGNLFFNTIYLVFLSLLVSVPLGVAAGIYMAEYAKQGKFTKFLRMCIETMSSLPSIVVGLFGYLVFIVMTGSQWNLFSGALAVSILSIPLIMTVTEDAFKSLPQGYKRGSLAMGATLWQTIYKVLLPACLPRIMTGVILAAGRGRRHEHRYQLEQLEPAVSDLPAEPLPSRRNAGTAYLGIAHRGFGSQCGADGQPFFSNTDAAGAVL